MGALQTADLIVLGLYLTLITIAGLVLSRRAGRSIEDFFVGARSLPWWLLGISMAATNFSIDTPIAITELVIGEGIVGVWYSWSAAISALLATFLFSRLWQRSQVLTDAELIELRYSGPSAAFLRLFKGLYFGLLFNAFIMGWVFLALIKVLRGIGDFDLAPVLVATTILVFIYSLASGFYGVVLTDFVQYFVALVGSIILAVLAVRRVGGLDGLTQGLEQEHSGTLDFLPSGASGIGPLSVFFTYILVQWWANKYSDGGGKHIQRMLSARSEDDAFWASLLYSFLNFALQIWPWILTALSALLLFGPAGDPAEKYSRMMVEVLPAGLLGLALAGLVGAFMSTIDTHLNLGASYLINDIYKRFIRRGRPTSSRHDVIASRIAMAFLLAISIVIALNMKSVSGAWKFLLTFASGAGPVWVARWFWWRINAWSEISAMLASGVIATSLHLWYPDWIYSSKLLTTVGISMAVWVIVTFLSAPTSPDQLDRFTERVRPGWGRGAGHDDVTPYLKPALLRWSIALVAFFGINFGVGALLLKSIPLGLSILAIGIVGLVALRATLRRLPD